MEMNLYVVTADCPEIGRTHADVARAALTAGCRWIQYRDKDMVVAEGGDQLETIRQLTIEHRAMLVVNDYVGLATRVGADALHLGQSDTPLSVARAGFSGIIGASATTVPEAVAAAAAGADYVGFGPIFATRSKSDAAPPVGLHGLRAICGLIDVPIVAIGGISAENVGDVVEAGADGVAVISAVAGAPDMEGAARELIELIEKGKRLRHAHTNRSLNKRGRVPRDIRYRA